MAKLDLQATVDKALLRQIKEQIAFIEGVLLLDIDVVRREGRCCDVLRSLKNEAQELQANAMRNLLASPSIDDPYAKSRRPRGA